MDNEGHGQRIWCSKSGTCAFSDKPQPVGLPVPSDSGCSTDCDNGSASDEGSSVENSAPPCNEDKLAKPKSKLSQEQRSQLWQKHSSDPRLTQAKLAEWAKNEFHLEKLTQATVSKVLADFRGAAATGGNLTNEQFQLIVQQSKHKGMTQEKLRHWAKRQFNMKKLPSQSTISNILNNKRRIPESLDDQNRGLKRKRIVKSTELDNVLAEWILQRQGNGVIMTWSLIQAKARVFADQLNLSESQRPTFSDGWLEKFLERHGLRTVKMSGESGSADVAAIEAALPDLQAIIQSYAPRDVFNMDETGLFYCLAPDRTIASRQIEGMKKDKTRISIALCVNSDGSEKEELMIIGHSAKPRAFNKRTGRQLGFCYRYNKKAWMTSQLFQEWLQRFDSRMRHDQRQVLLLLDNAPTHMVKNLALSNVQVTFLPPNTTSRIQPMDAGIIAAFKKRYRSFHLSHAIDRDAAGEKLIYKVDILKAMKWAKAAWNAITPETIANCWRHTGLLATNVPASACVPTDDFLDEYLSESIKQLNICSVLTMEEMAEQEMQFKIHHSFSDHDLVELFSEVPQDPESSSSDDDDNQGPTLDEKIQALRTTLSILIENPIENEVSIRQVRRILLEYRREQAENHTNFLKQSDIRSFFQK
jgi:hypothetical protein